MAVEAGIKGRAGRIISLKHLLERFSMDAENLHSGEYSHVERLRRFAN